MENFDFFDKIKQHTDLINNFLNFGDKALLEYGTEKYKEFVLTKILIPEENYYKIGVELGKLFVNKELAKSTITNYFSAFKKFIEVYINSLKTKTQEILNQLNVLESELTAINLKLDENDYYSDISIFKRKITDSESKLKIFSQFNYEFNNLKKFYDDSEKVFESIILLLKEYGGVDTSFLTKINDFVIEENKKIIKSELEFTVKIQKIQELEQLKSQILKSKLQNSDDLKSLIDSKIKEITQFYTNYKLLRSNNNGDKAYKIKPLFYILILFIFLIIVLFGEFKLLTKTIYNAVIGEYLFDSSNTLLDNFLGVIFIIGYSLIFGLGYKFFYEHLKDKKRFKTWMYSIIVIVIFFTALSGAFLVLYEKNILNRVDNPFAYQASLLFLYTLLTNLFGAIGGLLFVEIFESISNYLDTNKKGFFSSLQKIFRRIFKIRTYSDIYEKQSIDSIIYFNTRITELFNRKFEFEKLIVDVKLTKEKLEYDSNLNSLLTEWLTNLENAAISNFETGFEFGLNSSIQDNTKDEEYLLDINNKKSIINKFFENQIKIKKL